MVITSSLMKAMKHRLKYLVANSILGLFLVASVQAEERGQSLYMMNCKTCHGVDGKGQTDVGKSLKARDFTIDPFKQGNTVEAVANTILKGVAGTGMVGFPYLNQADRIELAKYVIALHNPQENQPVVASHAPEPVKIQVAQTEAIKAVEKVKEEAKQPLQAQLVAVAPIKTETPKTEAHAASAVVAQNEAPKPAATSKESEVVGKGRTLYKSNGCNSCHGDDLLAATPTGMALKARNLIKDPYKQGATVEGVVGTLNKGVVGTAMAPFPQIADADKTAIATFIMAVREGKATAVDESASVSSVSSNKVSITYAMSLIAEDLKKPFKVSFKSEHQGAKVYVENCASCHGSNGEGNIAAKMISSAPFYRVKTQALLGHKGYWLTDKASFIKLVTEGLPGRLMPGNGTLTSKELDALFEYFKECYLKVN